MAERPIILIELRDSAAAERLSAALETGGFVSTAESDAADILIADGPSPGVQRITALHDRSAQADLEASADIALIVAAVRLVTAGYAVSRSTTEDDDFGPNDGEPPESGAPLPPLSAREREVLALLADGAQNKVIARALNISVHTAKFHVASLLAKLGAINRTDAIVIAMREGLVPL